MSCSSKWPCSSLDTQRGSEQQRSSLATVQTVAAGTAPRALRTVPVRDGVGTPTRDERVEMLADGRCTSDATRRLRPSVAETTEAGCAASHRQPKIRQAMSNNPSAGARIRTLQKQAPCPSRLRVPSTPENSLGRAEKPILRSVERTEGGVCSQSPSTVRCASCTPADGGRVSGPPGRPHRRSDGAHPAGRDPARLRRACL